MYGKEKQTMKAILVNDNRSLRWDDVPNPTVKDDEVLIKIEAAALNRADLMQREGDYPPPAGCPEWMGLEIAGEIVEMGEDAKVAVRNVRRDALDKFKKQEKAKEITEDELKGIETDIQKMTDKYISEIDKMVGEKEQEIMAV